MTQVMHKWRVWAFVGVCAIAGGAAVASLMTARRAATSATLTPSTNADLPAPPQTPFLLVRNLPSGPRWGHVALVPLAAIDGPRYVSALACVRVHYAGGRGLCLTSAGPTGEAVVFDERLEPRHTFPLTGAPSRARVSRDGRRGAVTVFAPVRPPFCAKCLTFQACSCNVLICSLNCLFVLSACKPSQRCVARSNGSTRDPHDST